MTDDKLEILRLNGELILKDKSIEESLNWWAEEMLFWRTKYLQEHPEQANFDYVQTARETEKIDVMMFI